MQLKKNFREGVSENLKKKTENIKKYLKKKKNRIK